MKKAKYIITYSVTENSITSHKTEEITIAPSLYLSILAMSNLNKTYRLISKTEINEDK